MRSWLIGFFGPSITGWGYSITGFTLVLTGRVSVFEPFCLPKVVQNPPVLPALHLPRCRLLPAALPACRVLPHGLPPAVILAACLPCCLPACLPACRYRLPRWLLVLPLFSACRLPYPCRITGAHYIGPACRVPVKRLQSAHKKALRRGTA